MVSRRQGRRLDEREEEQHPGVGEVGVGGAGIEAVGVEVGEGEGLRIGRCRQTAMPAWWRTALWAPSQPTT